MIFFTATSIRERQHCNLFVLSLISALTDVSSTSVSVATVIPSVLKGSAFLGLHSEVCHYGSYGRDEFEFHQFKFASPEIRPGFRTLPPQCPSCRVVSSWDNEDNNHDGDNDEDNDNEPEEHEGDDKFGLLECSCCGWKNSYYLGDEWEEMSGEGILAKGKWWGRKIVVV